MVLREELKGGGSFRVQRGTEGNEGGWETEVGEVAWDPVSKVLWNMQGSFECDFKSCGKFVSGFR